MKIQNIVVFAMKYWIVQKSLKHRQLTYQTEGLDLNIQNTEVNAIEYWIVITLHLDIYPKISENKRHMCMLWYPDLKWKFCISAIVC